MADCADFPRPRIITPNEHRITPWKNGLGTTADVFIFPDGSSHDTFDIRVSLAPISSEGVFSSFPGIDRWVTRLSQNGLSLDFGNEDVQTLERLQPLLFDSARTPCSRLPDGNAQVLNVMTRRGRWTASVRPLPGGTSTIELRKDALSILYLVTGYWTAQNERTELCGSPGDTFVSPGPTRLRIAGTDGAEALLAVLTRGGMERPEPS
jgi:environmental stress-induced protein Ves